MPSKEAQKCCQVWLTSIIAFIAITLCIYYTAVEEYVAAFFFGVVAAVICLLLYLIKQAKRFNYSMEWSTESSSTSCTTTISTSQTSSSMPATVNTVSSAVRFSPPPLHPQPRRPSPPTPPTGRRPSHSSVSFSSQLSHAYYTNSSNFSPYITSQSIEERSSVHSPSTTWSPSPSAPIIIGFTPSDAAQHLSTRQTANELPPAYPEVMEDSRLPPGPYMTPSTSGGYGEVFGPSSDGLPSYETVVATRQPRGDSPPPYIPS